MGKGEGIAGRGQESEICFDLEKWCALSYRFLSNVKLERTGFGKMVRGQGSVISGQGGYNPDQVADRAVRLEN